MGTKQVNTDRKNYDIEKQTLGRKTPAEAKEVKTKDTTTKKR